MNARTLLIVLLLIALAYTIFAQTRLHPQQIDQLRETAARGSGVYLWSTPAPTSTVYTDPVTKKLATADAYLYVDEADGMLKVLLKNGTVFLVSK